MLAAIQMNDEAWLICGGRDFANGVMFRDAMSEIVGMFGFPSSIIHGGASGADTMAGKWADGKGISVTKMPADWKAHGRAAGPIRNAEMLKLRPARVIAFPGGRGTSDMVKRARNAGIEVIEVRDGPEAAQ